MNARLAKAIQDIKLSNYSLKTVQHLHETGFNFEQLNDCSQAGKVICSLVSHNFGLGLRLLTSCGICLALEDTSNGNTPLILAAAEGLCGPVKYLIDNVPTEHLLHVNSSRVSVVHLLLTRAHGSCGCLEALLRRLPIRENDSPNNDSSAVILKMDSLLAGIKTRCLKRTMGVIGLWISINYIDLQMPNHDISHLEMEARLLLPLMTICREQPGIGPEMVEKCLNIIAKLLILDQIDIQCIHKFLCTINLDNEINDKASILQLLREGLNRLSTIFFSVQPLSYIVVRALRCQLQKSMTHGYHYKAPTKAGEFIFHEQVNRFMLPSHLKKMLLLQGNIAI